MALWHDVRLALRSFARSPAMALVAVLSLGIGIGAMSTVYLWVDQFVVDPLPGVPRTDRLLFVRTQQTNGEPTSISYPTYRDWAERARAFEGLAAKTLRTVGVRQREGEGVESAWASVVTGNFFDVLGSRAMLGRTFRVAEEGAAAPVVVLGHDFWLRRFQADSSLIGRQLVINGHGFEVVGVMPPAFGGSYVGLDLDLYVLVTTDPLLTGRDQLPHRGSMFLEGIGRLAEGATFADAKRDMARIAEELDRIHPDAANLAMVDPLTAVGPPSVMTPVLIALLVVTALVLLIACVNVANLLLARATARRKEIGVRLALGASRGRLIRQLMVESALLALGGGFVGLVLAFLGRDSLMRALPPVPFPVGFAFDMNYRVIGFGLGAALITTFVFGLWPAVQASKPDLVATLKGLISGSVRSRARSTLVGAQAALAMVALVCAGLFLRATERARTLDPGFHDPESLLLVETDLTAAGLDPTTGREAIARLLERVRAVPGVAHASTATFVPLGWSCCSSAQVTIEGYTPEPNENRPIVLNRVADDYFRTMGISVLDGRGFEAGDTQQAPPVVVVNQAFVRRYWGDQPALGRRITQGVIEATVVGVVADGRYRTLTERPMPLIYRSWAQSYTTSPILHVRAAGDPIGLIPALRREFQAVSSDLPFLAQRTMRDQMRQSTIGQEIGSRALTVFGGIALALAAVGLYGVMSYLVGQRTREIGVRVALGADARGVTAMVIRNGLRIVGVGILVGGALALAAGRMLSSMLLGVRPADPLTFGSVAVLLAVVAVLACLLPARRASRVDPIVALRTD